MNDILRKSRADLKREEQKIFRELKRAYREIEAGLMEEVNKTFLDIAENPNKVYEYSRVNQLLNQVRQEMQKYADDYVKPTVARGMVQSSFLGNEQARSILREAIGEVVVTPFLPIRALDEFTKFLSTGPLGSLFDSFGPEAAALARKQILTSLALGHNPHKTASLLRKSLGVSRSRALLIARTEINRAHREGNRQFYLNNQSRVEGWIWHAAPSSRTCAACWAMHGSVHPLNERMAAHPACRCTMVPKVKTWRDMGYQIDGDEVVPQGEDLFAQQDESVQRDVLGRHYDRYKNGEIQLRDFIHIKDGAYGRTITKKVPK